MKIYAPILASSVLASGPVRLGETGPEGALNDKVIILKDHPTRLTNNMDYIENIKGDKFGMSTTYANFNLQSYGCWCRGPKWDYGKGRAIDVFDELCRQQHHNYDCLLIEDQTCDVYGVDYSVDIFMLDREVYVECTDDINTDPCKAKTCMIDLQIVSQYVKQIENMIFPFMSDFGHDFGFEPEDNCPRGDNSGRDKICCGSFPYREWFLKNNDIDFRNRECCEYDDMDVQALWGDSNMKKGRYYDSSIEVCCSDGVAVIGGRCG